MRAPGGLSLWRRSGGAGAQGWRAAARCGRRDPVKAKLWLLIVLGGALLVGATAVGLLALTAPHRPSAPAHVYDDPAELTFEIIPYLQADHLIQAWSPMADYLSLQLGRPVHIKIASSMESLPTDLQQYHYPLAFGSSYDYVVAHHLAGYLPLVSNSLPTYGVIIVRKDSPLPSGEDASGLRGKRVAINSRGTAIYLAARAYALTHGGLRLESDAQIQVLGNLDAITQAVLSGRADAGVSYQPYLNTVPPATLAQLRVLFETARYPSPPIMVDPNLSPDLMAKLNHALMDPATFEQRQALLPPLGWTGLLHLDDKDFDSMRQLAQELDLPL